MIVLARGVSPGRSCVITNSIILNPGFVMATHTQPVPIGRGRFSMKAKPYTFLFLSRRRDTLTTSSHVVQREHRVTVG